MIKNTIFVMTHLASGWERLVARLNQHPRIHVFNTGASYAHPDDVKLLRQQIHKQGGAAAIWGDVILHNKDFAMRRLCQHYKMIVWTRPFKETVEELVERHGYGREQAEAYYGFRLQGIQQYWGRKFDRGVAAPWNPDLERDAFLSAVL